MIFSSVDGLTAVGVGRCILLDGCFDPIHFGHVGYIRSARLAFPDAQIVVVVAENSVIRAKGREPVFDQMARCQVVDGLAGVDVVVAADRPTHEIISAIRPGAYVKGFDWEGNLPADILTACALHDVQIVYLGQQLDSSTDRVRRWALKDADASLDRLEAFIAAQEPASAPWQPVTDYSFEARKAIEGPHAELILRWLCSCEDASILDYGCGPGHLVRMINEHPERGQVAAMGYDPHAPKNVPQVSSHVPPDERVWDLVICREVVEHCTVTEVAEVVRRLFRLSAKFVYITTRFTDKGVFDADTEFGVDPTHITCLSQPFLRSLCVLNGGKRRRDLEDKLDHQRKGRVLVYEVH